MGYMLQPMETATFATPGIHCTSCVANIDDALQELGGSIRTVSADLAGETVTVEYDPAVHDRAAIAAAIAAAGYPTV